MARCRRAPCRSGRPRTPSPLAACMQWARLQLAVLEADPHANKVRIRELGRRFGLATRETSLLVLERLDDYVRNEIEPPHPALREAYDKLAATSRRNRASSDAAHLAEVVRRFEARSAWLEPGVPEGRSEGRAAGCRGGPKRRGRRAVAAAPGTGRRRSRQHRRRTKRQRQSRRACTGCAGVAARHHLPPGGRRAVGGQEGGPSRRRRQHDLDRPQARHGRQRMDPAA